MSPASRFPTQIVVRRSMSNFLLLAASLIACFSSSCGSNSSTPPPPANTQIVLVTTGTANDQLTQFALQLQSLTLTDKKGNTVSLLSSPQSVEYLHLNGGIEPLAVATIPADTYTSASATVGNAQFTCIEQSPGVLDTSTFAYGQTPQANVTVNLPAPLVVSGNTMGLSLNFLVQQSAMLSVCYSPNSLYSFTITPTFTLAPYTLASQPTSAANGKVSGFNGQIATLGVTGQSFTVSLPNLENSRTDSASAPASTVFQGVANFSSLAVGTFINMDGAVQPDGSMLATRISVPDPSASSLTAGPVLFVDAIAPDLTFFGVQEQGGPYLGINLIGSEDFTFPSATFAISGQLSNLQQLPFTPVFNASNMVPGQNVYLTSPSQSLSGSPYPPVTTMTLIPQTIDGSVSGVSTSGNFTVYSVDLASYDLFPNLAVQPGQTTLLNNPAELEVYVDSSTQQLNSQSVASGGVFRFYGLVFNDNGTLRMDCAQINDGVSVSPLPAPPSNSTAKPGRAQILRDQQLASGLRRIDRLITPAQ